MKHVNPFSISSQSNVISPKGNKSNLSSFLSQNSFRSSNSIQVITTKMCITPQQKVTNHASPRSKLITFHEQRFQKKALERVKFVSEHSNTPYLYISKKQHDIRIPIFPKLSPEPKLEISRIPQINIMTEPTAAIEEHSDEGRSNEQQSSDNSLGYNQQLLNATNNILQISHVSKTQDDQLSISRQSLKSRFKSAVQKSFRSAPRKSLFNVLISHEFNVFHEEERKSIHSKIENGNQVLANKMIYKAKENNQRKCLKDFKMKKRDRFVNMDQFTVSMKAFQRKVNLIHQASSKNLFCPESFSLFSKNSRKSIMSSNQKILNDLILSPPREEGKVQEKFNVTIVYEGNEQQFVFNKPSFVYKKIDAPIEEQNQIQIQTPKQSSLGSLFSQSKCIRQASSRKLEYLASKRLVRQSIQPNPVTDEMNNQLDLDSNYSKAKLFVRVYYQNKLYKLIQKTNYSKANLKEIEENFQPKIAQSSTMQTASVYTVMSTTDPLVRQRRITNEFLDKVQCVVIQLPKYSIEYENNNFEYDDEQISSNSYSSDDSDSEVSFEKYLESPAQNRKPLQKRKSQKKQKTILSQQNFPSEVTPQFFNDHPIDYRQLSTGSLVLIKKIRKAFLIPLVFQPIISTLEQSTKNRLLTFKNPIIEKFDIPMQKDQSLRVIIELQQFEKNSYLNKMIFHVIEMKYESILIGRYESYTKMIDVEHQDPPQQAIIFEKQDTKYEKIEQMQNSTVKASTKNSHRDSSKESGKKKQLQNSKSKNLSQRHLTKQDSLHVKQTQWNKKAMLSGEFSNIQTVQHSNQQTSNLFTQTSTVLITKPTQTSQQSVFRVMSSKHIDLNSSQQDLSSSFHSSQNEETPQSGQMNNLQQQQPQQQQPQQQMLQTQHQEPQKALKTPHYNRDNSLRVIDERDKHSNLQGNSKNELSMYMFSLRMRTHIKESQRRQKLNQLELISLSIFDHNYTEFMDNIQLIPEAQLDSLLSNGNSFLILAAQCGNSEMVRELIKRGAEINHQNDDGNTAVHVAMAYGHYKIADILIEAGGSTYLTNKYGQTAWGLL